MNLNDYKKLAPGDPVRARELRSIAGETLRVPDAKKLVHLQLRRFAGCPVCNLHLHALTRRREEIATANVLELIVFHSSPEELSKHAAGVPFALIADPEKQLYRELGAEAAPRALLDPRAWPTILHAIYRSSWQTLRGKPLPPLNPAGGRYGLPADFLIDPAGIVIACKYGEHADDQWSVDELLRHARGAQQRVHPETASL